METIACSAPYGTGGLGRFLAQMVEDARARDVLAFYYSSSVKPDDSEGREINMSLATHVNEYTPLRLSPGWKNYLSCDFFDGAVAMRLERAEVFTGFNGQALRSFHCARRLGYEGLKLESATAHVNSVMRQQEKAARIFGVEAGWLNEAQRRKTLQEYEMADIIVVTSEYTRQTFLSEGIPSDKLRRRQQSIDGRFTPSHTRPDDGLFRIVYVGSLTVMKGIPVLLHAFARFQEREAELTLVGGWATRGMRRYLQDWLHRDSRIRIAPGDPLSHLQRADVCVHPSFTDGLGLAPLEAQACGVPVIVTEDTGMKEYVQEGVNGFVVPTGSWEAIVDRLEALSRSPLGAASRGAAGCPTY
jgi:glycosyltransferase involved in cell wall biosynthesis